MKSRYWLLLAPVLLLGAAAVLWFPQRSGPGTAETSTSPLAADYDYYIQNLQTTRFGSDGRAVSELRAERVTHYPDGDRAVLEAPRFTAYGEPGSVWQVGAETGTLTPDAKSGEERLELNGEVVLEKALTAGDFLEVRTTALTVFTGTEEAETAQPVTVRTRNTRLTGTGLRALLAQQRLELLNDVRGSHDPTPLP